MNQMTKNAMGKKCPACPARGHLVGAVCTYVFILGYKLLIYVYLLELKALYVV